MQVLVLSTSRQVTSLPTNLLPDAPFPQDRVSNLTWLIPTSLFLQPLRNFGTMWRKENTRVILKFQNNFRKITFFYVQFLQIFSSIRLQWNITKHRWGSLDPPASPLTSTPAFSDSSGAPNQYLQPLSVSACLAGARHPADAPPSSLGHLGVLHVIMGLQLFLHSAAFLQQFQWTRHCLCLRWRVLHACKKVHVLFVITQTCNLICTQVRRHTVLVPAMSRRWPI